MPTHEAVVNTMVPREVEKPIPVRTVNTRTVPRSPQNIDQVVTPEVSPAADSAAPAGSVKLSPQLSALARKEQAYRQREQALKEREKSLESRLAEAEQYSQLKAKIGSKDYSVAEALGLSYEEYTKYLLDKQTGEDPNAQKFKTLDDEIQALKKSQEDKATKEYEDTVADYKREIAKLVESSADFPKVKKAKKEDAVLQYILDSFDDDPNSDMTLEQAAKDVEQFLTEQAKQWASLIEEPKQEEVQPKLPPPRVGSKTLTQQMQGTSTTEIPKKSMQHMSDSERYEEARKRAIARLQQQGV